MIVVIDLQISSDRPVQTCNKPVKLVPGGSFRPDQLEYERKEKRCAKTGAYEYAIPNWISAFGPVPRETAERMRGFK